MIERINLFYIHLVTHHRRSSRIDVALQRLMARRDHAPRGCTTGAQQRGAERSGGVVRGGEFPVKGIRPRDANGLDRSAALYHLAMACVQRKGEAAKGR